MRLMENDLQGTLEQLALSPQYGFSFGGGSGQAINEGDAKRKLERVVDVANYVWG